jgi:hypothetical protein
MENKFINFKVHCNRDIGYIRDMQIKLVNTTEFGYIPRCNGCNEMNGSEVCDTCVGKIISMFSKNPDLEVSEPLTV